MAEESNSEAFPGKECMARPRKPWVALILSICPGMGQIYSGNPFRGITLYASLILVAWLSAVSFMYTTSVYIGISMLALPFIFAIGITADAVLCALHKPYEYIMAWYNRAWIYLITVFLLLVTVNPLMDYLVGAHIARAYFVTTDSMAPTILAHDIVLINKLANFERNSVVLLAYDDREMGNSVTHMVERSILRRIIAIPGDEVEMRGRKVYINKHELYERYVRNGNGVSPNPFARDDYQWGPEIVPKDSFYVLSDSREYSMDSRMVGFVNSGNVVGVAEKVFWSWNFEEGRIRWERTAMHIQ